MAGACAQNTKRIFFNTFFFFFCYNASIIIYRYFFLFRTLFFQLFYIIIFFPSNSAFAFLLCLLFYPCIFSSAFSLYRLCHLPFFCIHSFLYFFGLVVTSLYTAGEKNNPASLYSLVHSLLKLLLPPQPHTDPRHLRAPF